MKTQRFKNFGVFVLMLLLLVPWMPRAQAAPPMAALKHKATLIAAARHEMGLEAPVALIAAQIHTESLWKEDAISYAGAQGLAQFMPATARWLPTVAPHTGEPLPFNPGWALRAVCAYDKWLFTKIFKTASDCDRWAFTLSAYNGGIGWVQKDRALAAQKGLDQARYWNQVELVNAGRRASAFKENRKYTRRIFALQGQYLSWGPGVSCE